MNSEKWLPVVGYEGRYEVSDMGNVRTLLGRSGPKTLKTFTDRKGYRRLRLCRIHGGIYTQKGFMVHILVLTAFVGIRPDARQAAHNNGVPGDNRLENLRWATQKENEADKIKHGTSPHGERNGNAIASWDIVKIIRELSGIVKGRNLSRLFGLSESAISLIRAGKTWAGETG